MPARLAAFEPRTDEDLLVLADFLPFRLALASQAVSQLIAATLEERFGFTIPAWRLLCLLAENGELDLMGLASRAALLEADARAAARALIARGLIAGPEPLTTLAITPAGHATHAELAGLAQAAEAALVSGLTPDDVRTLRRLLGKLETAALKLSGRG